MKKSIRPTPRVLYTCLLAVCALFVLMRLAAGTWLQTAADDLLPPERLPGVAVQAAQQRTEQLAQRQIRALVGSADAETAFQTAKHIAQSWQDSGLFGQVSPYALPDKEQAAADVRVLGPALLPAEQRDLLLLDAPSYFQKLAADENGIIPAWMPETADIRRLGFVRYLPQRALPADGSRLDAAHNMRYREAEGKTWVLLEAEQLPGKTEETAALMQQSRTLATNQGSELLVDAPALAAAASVRHARHHALLLAASTAVLAAVLLWRTFRRKRSSVLLAVPAAGILYGTAAVLLFFPQVHLYTLILGAGWLLVLADWPLFALLAAAWPQAEDEAADGSRRLRRLFSAAAAATLAGLAVLCFAPLPLLQQFGVFTAFALTGAWGAYTLWLPQPWATLAHRVPSGILPDTAAAALHLNGRLKNRLRRKHGWTVLAILLLAFGWWRSDWQESGSRRFDSPSEWQSQSEAFVRISGHNGDTRYLLVEADSEDALLERSALAARAVLVLPEAQRPAAAESLDQWILPVADQQLLLGRLNDIARSSRHFSAMRQAGVSNAQMRQILRQTAEQPPLTLSDSLPLAAAQYRRALYLGEIEAQHYAALVRLEGVGDAAAVAQAAARLPGTTLLDPDQPLNIMLQETRNQLLMLKGASCLLVWVLWQRLFGWRRATRLLAVPLGAAVCTVGILGLAGIPVGLFAVFGLLLATAAGTDYAVYAVSRDAASQRQGSLLLAAALTGLPCLLLAFSHIPAVTALGFGTAVGIALNLLFASWLIGGEPQQKADLLTFKTGK